MACTNCSSQEDFSPSNILKNGCPMEIPGDCLYYSGINIPSLGIVTGDTFNDVFKKFAQHFGLLSGIVDDHGDDIDLINQELGNSTTSTTSTTTTTTTTTGVTTSTTTTSTTTSVVSSLVYVGDNDTGIAPTAGQIIAGISSTQDETANVSADWTSFNAAPHYLWFAIKINGTGSNKNRWLETVSNFGNIGTVDDLFGALTTVSVSGVPYYVGITNYATQFSGVVTLSHV